MKSNFYKRTFIAALSLMVSFAMTIFTYADANVFKNGDKSAEIASIQAALEKLLTGRTSFVIAHRLSTIRNADQVLVLVAGEIVERGRHEELLEQKGAYYDLYMSQFLSPVSAETV